MFFAIVLVLGQSYLLFGGMEQNEHWMNQLFLYDSDIQNVIIQDTTFRT